MEVKRTGVAPDGDKEKESIPAARTEIKKNCVDLRRGDRVL